MEVKGIVKLVGETQHVSDKFKKRDIVVTTQETYPQHISIQFVQDKVSALDGIIEGEEVEVGINLKGRSWRSPQGEEKFFNTIQGWRIDVVNNSTTPQPTAAPAPAAASDVDELPF